MVNFHDAVLEYMTVFKNMRALDCNVMQSLVAKAVYSRQYSGLSMALQHRTVPLTRLMTPWLSS